MLRKLRTHLMLMCAVMTSVVFFLSFGFNFISTVSRYRQLNQLSFEELVRTVSERLTEDIHLDDAWIGDMEAANQCVISVSNNGQALFFPGAWQPVTDRRQLLTQANEQALKKQVDPFHPPASWEMAQANGFMRGAGQDRYRMSVTVFPSYNEKWLGLTILQSVQREQEHIRALLLNYAAVSFVAVALLVLLSWWLSGKAVRPTSQSLEKQKAFIAAASHELRSPLAVIKTSASAIRIAPDQTGEMLDSIEEECTFLSNLVDDLLLVANMDTGRWKLNKRRVDLDTILIELVDKLTPVAEEQGYRLTLQMPDNTLPEIVGDGERLSQVFTILIDNAVVHAGNPGEICLSAQEANKQLIIRVTDHGVGIPAELREKVFDRFYSVNPSWSQRKNFGLGLSIAKELVLLHDGSISIEETFGGGCTFVVKLPVG